MTAVYEEAKVSDSLLLWDVTLPVTVRYNCAPAGSLVAPCGPTSQGPKLI